MNHKQCERARFLYVFDGKNEQEVADMLGVPLPDMLKFLSGGYLDATAAAADLAAKVERKREQARKYRTKQPARTTKPDVFDAFVDSIAQGKR